MSVKRETAIAPHAYSNFLEATTEPIRPLGAGVSPCYCPMPLRVTVTVRCFGSLLVICTVLFAAPATVGAN